MRSKIFVPASRPDLFQKAAASAADAISFDLEDAVEAASKGMARDMLADHLRLPRTHSKTVIVRVNQCETSDFEADIASVLQDGVDVINLPKIEDPVRLCSAIDRIDAQSSRCGRTNPVRFLVNIESPAGLHRAVEIAAAHPRIMGLQIGFGDLFAPYGIAPLNALAIAQVRWQVRMAAALAGIDAYDGAFFDVSAPDAFCEDARAARDMGFAGKTCIHPSQIDLANSIFQIGAEELAHARKVVAAAEQARMQGIGALLVDGRLIDGPLITRAQRVVQAALHQSTTS